MGLQSLVLLLCAVRATEREPKNASLALARSAPLPLAADRRLSDQYAQITKLAASDAAVRAAFGYSVAINGDTIVVGAYGDWSGSVYVFRATDGGATHDEVAKLTAADAAEDDRFGYAVAIDGDTVVVGAYQDDDAGSGSGSVYVFRTSDGGATYAQVAKVTAADAAWANYFGYSVAIDGNTIVVGAYQYAIGPGATYVFRTTDGGATYVEVAKLTAADAADGDRFGISVAIDGNTVVVGAYKKDGYTGAVYVFRTTDGGASYDQVAKLTAGDAAAYDVFGYSVAIDGSTIVVGAYGNGDAGSRSGSVYVFREEAFVKTKIPAFYTRKRGDRRITGVRFPPKVVSIPARIFFA